MVGTGLVLGGMAAARGERARREIEERRVALAEREMGLRREDQQRKAITDAIDRTRQEIDALIDVAREAKAKGATPAQLNAIRDQINIRASQLGVAMPGIPQPRGTVSVPGGETVIQAGLNRFDALVGATQPPAIEPPPGPATAGPFAGTSEFAQTSNILVNLSNKIRAGQPLSQEERSAYSVAYGAATRPRVIGSAETGFSLEQPTLDASRFPRPEDIGALPAATAPAVQPTAPTPAAAAPPAASPIPTGQPPAGAAPVPGAPTPAGVTITPIETPGQARKAAEANRLQLIEQGTKAATAFRDRLLNPDGSINRDVLLTMNVDIPGFGSGLPFTEGRTARSLFENAVSAKLRGESGATITLEDTEDQLRQFLPSPLDSDELIRDKARRFVEFFEGSLEKTNPALFQRLKTRAEAERGNAPKPPPGEEDATFTGFSRESGLPVFRRPDGTHFEDPNFGR